jgi:hypothetical protein
MANVRAAIPLSTQSDFTIHQGIEDSISGETRPMYYADGQIATLLKSNPERYQIRQASSTVHHTI